MKITTTQRILFAAVLPITLFGLTNHNPVRQNSNGSNIIETSSLENTTGSTATVIQPTTPIDTTPTLSLTIVPTITQTSNTLVTLTTTPEISPTLQVPSATPSPPPTQPITTTLAITSSNDLLTTDSQIFLPLAFKNPAPVYINPERNLYCSWHSSAIPDNVAYGIDSPISITTQGQIVDMDVYLDVNHTWIGDVKIKLTHYETDRTITLIDRPGYPGSQYGCGNDNIRTILDDEISSSVAAKCASSPAAISGIYQPEVPLSTFDGESINATWILNISDRAQNDTGRLNGWCILATTSISPPPPTPTPEIPPFPAQAIINNVSGRSQALPLDCESRSAVDWAKYFGYDINEIQFFNNLPESDNPDKGFVGNVYGQWGQIPPNAYGIHAEPVAALLRLYGLQAYAHKPLSWDALRAEISAGRPVIVWIIGSIINGAPVYYIPQDGLTTIVARYEHTVIVTGYTQSVVYYLNGGTIYSKSISQFLDSWSALGNMAVTANP